MSDNNENDESQDGSPKVPHADGGTTTETEPKSVDLLEQQATAEGETDPSDLAPRGEHRGGDGFVVSRGGAIETPTKWSNWLRQSTGGTATDIEPVPADARESYRLYCQEFAIVQSALRKFDDLVLEPEWEVEAKIDGELDEDMTEALELWGDNCAVRAGEAGHNLNHILSQCPSGRRAKPAVLIEKIGTTDDPDAIAALQMLEPWDMSARLRKDQNLVVQPGDDVPADHPTVEKNGQEVPAAYVQYDSSSDRFGMGTDDDDEIPFAENDLLKLTYEPPEGSAWGQTIWPPLAEPIESLKQKLRDRNAAIRLTGHPHRIYSSDSWTKEQAQKFANMHDEGETSAWDLEQEREKMSYAGRVDYVPHTVNVQVVDGDVADISDAVKDDLEQIFSILPLSKHNIAYVDEINQFVVEPLDDNDDRNVDKERRYLESIFGPLFQEKADGLAGREDGYEGEVSFHIRQPESDNPLERSEFDPERVAKLVGAFTEFVKSGASSEFPRELPYFFAGMDREGFEDEYADTPLEPESDEDEDVEEPAETEPPADDADADADADADEEAEEDVDEADEEVQTAARELGIGADASSPAQPSPGVPTVDSESD